VGLAAGGTSRRGQGSHGSNTTVVVPVPRHEDITTHAPRSSPTVLDNPVVLAASGTITHSEHTMIKGSGAASRLVVNASRVELEGVLRSIDGDASGTQGNLGLKIRFAAGGHIDVGGQLRTTVGGVVLAGSVLSSVRIGRLGIDTTVGDDVDEGLSHEATIATLIALRSRAVNQVLLGEADKGASEESVSTFNRASSGERPARTALALVLDTSDYALGPPVNRGWEGGNVDLKRRGGNIEVNLLQALEEVVEFVVGEVSEFVHANSERHIRSRVEFLHPHVVRLPGGIPVLELIGGIHLVVGPHPFGEGSLEVRLLAVDCSDAEGEKDNDDFVHCKSFGVV